MVIFVPLTILRCVWVKHKFKCQIWFPLGVVYSESTQGALLFQQQQWSHYETSMWMPMITDHDVYFPAC